MNAKLYIAWLISVVGFVVSLFSGLFYHLPICDLCWYQRICLYPLALILGVAAYHNDLSITRYTLPLSIIGFFFALYHYIEQLFPYWTPIYLCSTAPDAVICSNSHFKWLGFITYPFVSMLTFAIISLLLWTLLHKQE